MIYDDEKVMEHSSEVFMMMMMSVDVSLSVDTQLII